MSNLTEQQIVDLFKDAPKGYDYFLLCRRDNTRGGLCRKDGELFIFYDEGQVININEWEVIIKPQSQHIFTKAMSDAEIHESNNSGAFTVIERDGCERVTVQFIKTGYTTVTTNQNVKNGQVKDKLRPSVYGIGFVGAGHYTPRVKGNISKPYQAWVSMLERCYSDLQDVNNPTYKGCTVCGDWHNFQLFAEWFNNNYIEGYHLDKDIKNKGNKMYSPFSCIFVSAKENVEQAHAKSYTMISPDGVSVDIYNMSKHCAEYGLCSGHMSSVVNGKRPSHKGWTLDTRTDSEKADDLFKFYLKGENVSTHKSFSQAVKDGDFGDNILWSK